MAKHRRRDEDFEPVSGEVEDIAPRTMERDSGGVQGMEYFGVDTRDEEDSK